MRRLIERVDPEISFDFGVESPDSSKEFDKHKYAINWEGSILAPETGDYEFIIRTENAARLWINDLKRPLIDAGVKSGNDTEYRQSIRLLGGRVYPLRLEFAKGKQGEPDKKKVEEPKPTKASITLLWKIPQQAEQVIPRRNLSPSKVAESFVVQTPFPPDDRSVGYERGSSISKAWDQATTDAAIEVAAYVVAHLAELSGIKEDAKDREPRLREFSARFVERALRRPLSDDQKKLFVNRMFETSKDAETALRAPSCWLSNRRGSCITS